MRSKGIWNVVVPAWRKTRTSLLIDGRTDGTAQAEKPSDIMHPHLLVVEVRAVIYHFGFLP